jgi:hypothetical protein
MKPRSLITAATLLAATALSAVTGAYETGDEALSVTGDSRIAVSLDGRGYLREIESGGLRLGLRWPGVRGTEFLGSGGLLMRFSIGEAGEAVKLGPGDFLSVLDGQGVAGATEDCSGGRRYPADGCDDDGDGEVDEDPLDGRDNDGDGRIDEDFAAIGGSMYVTSARAPLYGIVVTRSHYVWKYGHVRDFIGFSTTIEYLPPEGYDEVLRDFELVHFIDFEIGGKDERGRGRDDAAFYMQVLPADGEDAPPPAAAVSGAGRDGPMAAVVFFSAARPGGDMAAGAAVRKRQRHVDSLWSGQEERIPVLGADAAGLDPDRAELMHGARGRDMLVERAGEGDIVLTHAISPALDLYPGDRVELEWAIVFGMDHASLARNISRARETWEGHALPGGDELRWVVPARKAVRVEAQSAIAPVWVQGEKRPAVSVDLPAIEGEEIEWLRVAGELTGDYEVVGGRIVISIGDEAVLAPFAIEGQLTDGTMFTSYIGEEELQRYSGEEELQPGRLPEDSIKLFPNPFITDLTIDILVHEPSRYAESRGAVVQPGVSSVRVYDVKGRLVRTIVSDEVLHPGSHTLGWDGTDAAGAKVAAGVYYCRLQIGERSLTRRVVLLR